MKKTLLKMLMVYVLLFLAWWAAAAWYFHTVVMAYRAYGECFSRSWWIAALAAVLTGSFGSVILAAHGRNCAG